MLGQNLKGLLEPWLRGEAKDLKRLKKHYEQYEPTLTELRHKYEVAMKASLLTL